MNWGDEIHVLGSTEDWCQVFRDNVELLLLLLDEFRRNLVERQYEEIVCERYMVAGVDLGDKEDVGI